MKGLGKAPSVLRVGSINAGRSYRRNPMTDALALLIALRDDIAGFETVKCKLRHEIAWRDPDTGMPEWQAATGGVRRVGFCGKEQREKRLSCAHTGSWHTVVKAIVTLCEVTGADDAYRERLLGQYNQCLAQIMSSDHQKGEQEKVLALLPVKALEEGWSEDDLRQKRADMAGGIKGIVETHNNVVERLEGFRLELLGTMDRVIASAAPSSG